MPKVDKKILNAAREFGTSILELREDISDSQLFGHTSNHMVFWANSRIGASLCLKVNLRSVEADLMGKKVQAERTELHAFEIADNKAAWMPKMIDSCKDASWLLREWVGIDTSNRIQKADWTKQRLDDFWQLFADAFEMFHDRTEPYLIRDIKPTNVSYDEKRFYMFDFNTVKRLDQIRQSSVGSRLGNHSNQYLPPEVLRGKFSNIGLCADYFGFASVFQRFATGLNKSVWSNSQKSEAAAMTVYQSEYQSLKPSTESALIEHGYSRTEVEFVIACLNPSADLRPNLFLRPS